MDITSFLLGYESGKATGGGGVDNLDSVNAELDEINGEVIEGETEGKLNYLSETKDLIKTALITKGQTVTDETPFRSYADKLLDIGAAKTGVASSGSFVATSRQHTIEHNLGVFPDIVYVWAKNLVENPPSIFITCGFSEAMVSRFPEGTALGRHCWWMQAGDYGTTSALGVTYSMDWYTANSTDPFILSFGLPRNPTTTTFVVGSDYVDQNGNKAVGLEVGMEYNWTAVGGVF